MCALPLLLGHEGTILRVITSFSGVVRGRQLRCAQKALHALHSKKDHENNEEDGTEESDCGDEAAPVRAAQAIKAAVSSAVRHENASRLSGLRLTSG